MCIHVCLVWSVFPTAFRVPHHLPVCRQLHTDSPAQLDSIWTWRNAHMRSESSSPTGDRTRVARLAVQCSTDWATPSSLFLSSQILISFKMDNKMPILVLGVTWYLITLILNVHMLLQWAKVLNTHFQFIEDLKVQRGIELDNMSQLAMILGIGGLVVNGATRNAQCATDNLSVILWGLWNAMKGDNYLILRRGGLSILFGLINSFPHGLGREIYFHVAWAREN